MKARTRTKDAPAGDAPRLRKPRRDAKIIRARAEGKSLADAAAAAGCSVGTAYNVTKAHADYVEAERRRLQVKVLEGLNAPVRARMKDAANPDSRTGPASFRELREGILDWGPRSSVVLGDVNVDASQTVNVDARSVNVIASQPTELAGELARIRGGLGIG